MDLKISHSVYPDQMERNAQYQELHMRVSDYTPHQMWEELFKRIKEIRVLETSKRPPVRKIEFLKKNLDSYMAKFKLQSYLTSKISHS